MIDNGKDNICRGRVTHLCYIMVREGLSPVLQSITEEGEDMENDKLGIT